MPKVLFLAANPEVSRLRLEEESREIRQVFQLGTHRDRFAIHMRTDVRWRDLRQAIVELRPDVVHFSGHGRRGGLVLTDDGGAIEQHIPPSALRTLLASRLGVRMLVLSACDTAEYVESFLEVVDHVIAMRGALSDNGASLFAQGFYSAFANGHGIDTCFGVGKADLEARSPDPDDVHRPVHRFRPGARQDLGAETALFTDPLVAGLRAVTTQRNVFPFLPRRLGEDLGDAIQVINEVIDVISSADVLIQQAGDAIPEPYRGHRLTVGRVPLQAGAHHAWTSAVRDAAALSPFALMAILLVARERKPTLESLRIAIETIRNLDK